MASSWSSSWGGPKASVLIDSVISCGFMWDHFRQCNGVLHGKSSAVVLDKREDHLEAMCIIWMLAVMWCFHDCFFLPCLCICTFMNARCHLYMNLGKLVSEACKKIPYSLLLNYLVVRPSIQQFKQITEMWIIHYRRMKDSSCSSLLFLTALSSMRDKDIGTITACRDGAIDPTCPYCLVWFFFF